jgi:hypothetical protein
VAHWCVCCFCSLLLSCCRYGQQEEVELRRLESEAEETMFVLLSDVHLDSPEVMHKLRMMFEGFSMVDTPPVRVDALLGSFALYSIRGANTVVPVPEKKDPLF